MDARSDVPRFRLGRVCWLAGGVVALVVGTLSLLRARLAEPAYLAASFLVSALLTVLLAVLAGLIVWRLAGRSRRAGQVGFVVWLFIELAGSAIGVVRYTIAFNTVHDLREVQARRLEAMVEQLPEPLSPEQIPAALTALDGYFDPVAARAVGDGKALVEAVRAHHRLSATSLFDLKMAFDAIKDIEPTDFSGVWPPAERARRRSALRAAIGANRRLLQLQTEQLAALRARIAALDRFDRFADAVVQDVSQPGILFGPLEAQAAFFTQLLEIYDFLDARAGSWRVMPDGTLSFVHGPDADRFQASLDALDRLMKETARKNAEELSQIQSAGASGAGSPPGSR